MNDSRTQDIHPFSWAAIQYAPQIKANSQRIRTRTGTAGRPRVTLIPLPPLISGYKFSMPRWLAAGSLARWMGELWEIETPGRLKLHKTRDTRRTAFQVVSHDDGEFFHCLDFFHFFWKTLRGILRYFLLEMVCRRGGRGDTVLT